MKQDWRQRLEKGLKDKRLSKRGVSLSAGMGEGYVHSILKDGKDPTVDSFLKVCAASGLSPAYVLLGYDLTPEVEELLALWSAASPATRDGILQILAAHKAA